MQVVAQALLADGKSEEVLNPAPFNVAHGKFKSAVGVFSDAAITLVPLHLTGIPLYTSIAYKATQERLKERPSTWSFASYIHIYIYIAAALLAGLATQNTGFTCDTKKFRILVLSHKLHARGRGLGLGA